MVLGTGLLAGRRLKRARAEGEAHFGAGLYRDAEAAYRIAVAIDPGSGACWHRLGLCLVRLGRTEEGAEALRQASRLLAGDAEILVDLGRAEYLLGQTTLALAAFRRALLIDPQSAGALEALQALDRQPDIVALTEGSATAFAHMMAPARSELAGLAEGLAEARRRQAMEVEALQHRLAPLEALARDGSGTALPAIEAEIGDLRRQMGVIQTLSERLGELQQAVLGNQALVDRLLDDDLPGLGQVVEETSHQTRMLARDQQQTAARLASLEAGLQELHRDAGRESQAETRLRGLEALVQSTLAEVHRLAAAARTVPDNPGELVLLRELAATAQAQARRAEADVRRLDAIVADQARQLERLSALEEQLARLTGGAGAPARRRRSRTEKP